MKNNKIRLLREGEEMRASEVLQNLKDNNITEETRRFLIDKMESKQLIVSKKYGSIRCPCCNTVIQYKTGHYCIECGQKIKHLIQEEIPE